MLYTPAMTTPTLGLQRELYRLFEGAIAQGNQSKTDQNEWTPLVDIRETDRELNFAVEIAGSGASDVDVTTENGVLTIRGERSEEWKDEGRYHLVERGYGSFIRRFQLPEGVEIDKIQADVENGLLQVRIPKSAMPQPKTIHVKAVANGKNGGQVTNGRGEGRQDAPATVAKARAAK
jgi:HSP20 family protein